MINHQNCSLGISPVIAIILLVVLVIGLSSVAAFLAFDLTINSQDSGTPTVKKSVKDNARSIELVKKGSAERVIVRPENGNKFILNSTGDYITVPGDQRVQVLTSRGGKKALIRTFDIENKYLNETWPNYGYSKTRSAYLGGGAPDSLSVKWSSELPSSPWFRTPVVTSDRIFYYTTDNEIVSYNRYTGEQLWVESLNESGFTGHAVVSNGSLFIGSGQTLYRIDALSGGIEWKTNTTYGLGFTSPAIDEDTIYISGGNNLFAIYKSNGTTKWKRSVSASQPYPIVDENTVYIGAGTYTPGSGGGPAKIIAYNATNGNTVWSTEISGSDNQETVIGVTLDGDNLYAGTAESDSTGPSDDSGFVVTLYRSNGTIKNKVPIPDNGDSAVQYPVTSYEDTIYAPVGYGIVAIDKNGTVKWTKSSGFGWGSLTITKGKIYTTSTSSEKVMIIEADTGATIETKTYSSVNSAVIVIDGVAYASTNSNITAYGD